MAINFLAELESMGWKYEFSGPQEVKVLCPFHDDRTPSGSFNVEKGVFKCHACGASGDGFSFIAAATKTDRASVRAALAAKYGIHEEKTVDAEYVERCYSRIRSAGPLIKALYDRGLTDEDIDKYRLGEDKGRITIPVKNETGVYVNVRKYMPGAPSKDKMKNLRGRGEARFFPIDQLSFDTVVICGGECKAIVAARQLNPHGIGAICITAGENNWLPKFSQALRGKRVFTCLDVDEAGQKGANGILSAVYRLAESVANILLPLDVDKYPHGDINDYVAAGGQLLPLVESATPWEPALKRAEDTSAPIELDLNQASSAEYAKKRLSVKAVVSVLDTSPYIVPKCVVCECTRDQEKSCGICPVYHEEPDHKFTVPAESEAILAMVNAPSGVQRETLMHAIGVPRNCRVCSFRPLDFYTVEDAKVSPQLEITNRTAERVLLPACLVGDSAELNESYILTGKMHPHPKTQAATLLISNYETTQDALSTYRPQDTGRLTVFQPDSWTVEGISNKLADIYTDFEANVTRIYQRHDLHLAIDLCYHSPLLLPFDGKTEKGWAEVLILGDSAQGKSEAALNIMRHYGLGAKVECKNATVAGLLGGLQQINGRHYVTWGVIPTHDKRLVVLEELKGAHIDVIGKLTDMRSSGIAEIPKIEKRRTHARTRLLALSNPRGSKQLAAYSFGVEAIQELIGSLEDVRRFDFVLLVSAQDIDSKNINKLQQDRPTLPHKYTAELCRELVLWSWTRADSQVTYEAGAASLILEKSTALCTAFTDAVPIVDRGSMRLKLARLSASLAARTYSSDGEKLLIRCCHVEFVYRLLNRVYSSDVFGYVDYTNAIRMQEQLLDPDEIQKAIRSLPFAADFVKQILARQYIDRQDIEDWTGRDRLDAAEFMGFLVRKQALTRYRRTYTKTAPFIAMLKSMGTLKNRPELQKNEF